MTSVFNKKMHLVKYSIYMAKSMTVNFRSLMNVGLILIALGDKNIFIL